MPHFVRCLLGVLLCGAGFGCGGASAPEGASAPGAAAAPAVSTAPAAYVGDAACASCHAEIARTYAQTNKARSVTRFDPATAPERFDAATVYNARSDLYYEAFVRGDTLYQREYRLDEDGTVVHERIHRADYVIGSGNATRSYLMQVNGYLTEMPLTWYVQRSLWDMSPGYHEANDRFSRQINLECITCHNGPVRHTRFTQNHYADLPLGITCERCHGPAGAHVAFRRANPDATVEADSTIVNPARLDRSARLSICQQCHLAGVSVFPEGEDPTTFVPGEPLAAHRTVFVPEGQLTDPDWVGIDSHPVRLARSACYQKSEMTCGTCHDPHRPADLLPPDHYDRACQSCHGADADHVALEAMAPGCSRAEHGGEGLPETASCVSCHMATSGTSEVPHVFFSDHWIRRRPRAVRQDARGNAAVAGREPVRLVALQEAGRSAAVIAPRTTNTPRDQLEAAIAYLHFYETMHAHPAYIETVIDAARAGFAGGADHVEARIALARALGEADSTAAALAVLDAAAQAYPGDPWVHFWRGAFQEVEGQPEAAIQSFRRAAAIQPKLIEAQVKLADALVRAERVEEALARLEQVVALDPVHQPRAWHNLGTLRLRLGQAEAARDAFAQAVRLDPDLAPAHIQLGSMELARRAFEDAIRHFRQAIRAAPTDPAGYGSLGLTYLQAGRPDLARPLFEEVLRLDPTNRHARALLRQLEQRP